MNRPVHFEILADDPAAVGRFYESIFGWKITTWGGDQPYHLVTTGEQGTIGIDGGIMNRHFEQPVINTIEVSSLEETLQRIEEAGGRKLHGPSEIPGIGMHAYCADPEGTMFGLLQPAEGQ